MLKDYAKEAGVQVERLCLHALRATAATNALEHQADIEDPRLLCLAEKVEQLLGQSWGLKSGRGGSLLDCCHHASPGLR